MKGIINIEFVISLMVFMSTVSFVSIMIINTLPTLRYESVSNDMRSKAYQISNVLLLKLSDQETYVLNSNKIAEMQNFCNNYEAFRDLFSDYLILNIDYLDGTNLLSCKPQLETLVKPEFTLKRLATVNKEIVTMSVSIIR